LLAAPAPPGVNEVLAPFRSSAPSFPTDIAERWLTRSHLEFPSGTTIDGRDIAASEQTANVLTMSSGRLH
jgi:hypothetical protein